MNINGISSFDWSGLAAVGHRESPVSRQNIDSTGNELTDSVRLSSLDEPLYKTDKPGVYSTADGRLDVNIDEALTPRDKAIVTAATGALDLVDANGVHQINMLAVRIAMDRAYGNLNGPVTPAYLQGLAASQSRDAALNAAQADALQYSGDIAGASAIRAQKPSISSDVLDRALMFLAQNPDASAS